MSEDTLIASESTRPRRRRRIVRTVLLLLLCLAAVNGVIEFGQKDQVCDRCTASSTVKEIRVFGVGGEYHREIEMGRLAKFINNHGPSPCEHHWITTGRESGNLLYRHFEPDGLPIATLYSMMNATNLDLEELAKEDPTFFSALEAAVRSPTSPASRDIIAKLTEHVRKSLLKSPLQPKPPEP